MGARSLAVQAGAGRAESDMRDMWHDMADTGKCQCCLAAALRCGAENQAGLCGRR